MESVYWVYGSLVEKPNLELGQRLVCEGVDYQCLVKLNGSIEYGQEGMFTGFEIDLTDKLAGDDCLEVIVFPAPDSGDYSTAHSEVNACVKPPVSYGWNCHPWLISSGLWKNAYLEIRPESHITDVQLDYWLEETLEIAHIDLAIELNRRCEGSIQWVLTDPFGEVAEARSNQSAMRA